MTAAGMMQVSSRLIRGGSTASLWTTTDDQQTVNRDLHWLLEQKNLLDIAPNLLAMGCFSLEQLGNLDMASLRDTLPFTVSFDAIQQALSPASVALFTAGVQEKARHSLFKDMSRLHHFVFLSHYKAEAGTEAALIRTELEQAIRKDPGHHGHSFDEPIFLDSDNLDDLRELQEKVCTAHNLVLLLTQDVLSRPWVLVEIVTAMREGVRVILVNVSKPGTQFVYPDDAFYARFREGDFLDDDAVELLERCDCTMEEVEDAIREAFQKIAVPYSPHKGAGIRRAEIGALLKQCRLKSAAAGKAALDGRHSTHSAEFSKHRPRGSSRETELTWKHVDSLGARHQATYSTSPSRRRSLGSNLSSKPN